MVLAPVGGMHEVLVRHGLVGVEILCLSVENRGLSGRELDDGLSADALDRLTPVEDYGVQERSGLIELVGCQDFQAVDATGILGGTGDGEAPPSLCDPMMIITESRRKSANFATGISKELESHRGRNLVPFGNGHGIGRGTSGRQDPKERKDGRLPKYGRKDGASAPASIQL